LRVGLSAARGIALGLEVPAVGITTLTAFTVPLIDGDERSLIVSAIDARHGHMYAQIVSGAGQVFRPPQIYAIEALIAAVKSRSVRVVGSGAAMLARALQMEGIHPEAVDQLDGPDLGWIARLGVSANPEFAPPTPVYLKAPDAHPQTNGRVSHV
jgi:tRNA A37 threonylcarbamoyladenosine modification protein TsaB